MKKMFIATLLIVGLILVGIAVFIFMMSNVTIASSTMSVRSIEVSDRAIDLKLDFSASGLQYKGFVTEYRDDSLFIKINGTYIGFFASDPSSGISIPNSYGEIKAIYLSDGADEKNSRRIWQKSDPL